MKSRKIKVGDKVRVKEGACYAGRTGVVSHINKWDVDVRVDNWSEEERKNNYLGIEPFGVQYLELIERR